MKPNESSDDWKAMEAYMDAVEGNGPQTTLFALLEEARVAMPPPDTISDSDIKEVLWKVIHAMAELGTYLSSTDHLSDRDLYVVLWNDILREEYPIVPERFPLVKLMDVLGRWSNEDIETWLTYYADEDARQRASEYGTRALPDHVDPPYPRDHLLPKCGGGEGA
jgi:hypothetical protein